MPVIDKYNQRADKVNSLVCVGLDADFDKLPDKFKDTESPQFQFNKYVIEQTHEYAAAFKLNMTMYEDRHDQGIREMKMTMDYLIQNHPGVFTICDAKRGDIGHYNKGYLTSTFDWMNFDAITLHPYLGRESLKPFLDRADKVCIIVCHTSNPGAGELQDLAFGGKKLWEIVARKVASEWNDNNNCMLVTGATYPEEIAGVRKIVGDMTLLIPGIGAQGGDVKATVKAGLNSKNLGMIINSSRGIIFADDPGKAAKKLRDEINEYR
jgi:orotidine-5'-phosphate decarboxylase